MFNLFKQNRIGDLDVKQIASMAEWHKPQRRVLAKIISLLVTITFVLPYMTWAFEASSFQVAEKKIMFNNKPINIPKKLGTITQSFSGQDRVVVCVQDLHCNYEVQNNIAGMINDLAGKHGLNLVTVEGESVPINVSKLADFPLEQVKKDTAHYLMKQGKITGPELYAATGKHPIRLEGIENQAMYDDNRKNVMSFLNHESQGYIFDLRETLNELKAGIYTKALMRVDEKKQAFREGDIPVLKYSVYMYDYGVQAGLDMKRYSTLARYVSRRQNIFPESVDSDDLFNELDQLNRQLRSGLYTTTDQQVMDKLSHRLDIMEKLVNISAAPKDLAEFRENPEEFKVKSFLKYISRHDNEGLFMLDAEVYKLDRYLEEVRAFYRVADERSLAFVENVMARMDKHQTGIAAMVTGGYHKEEVLKELERHNISYVCVKPCLRHQDIINPYFALLRNKRTPLEKLLAQNQNILGLTSSFMGKAAGIFGRIIKQLNLHGIIAVAICSGKTTKSELVEFVSNIMPANPLKAAGVRMSKDGEIFILSLTGLKYSLVVHPKNKSRILAEEARFTRDIVDLGFTMVDNEVLKTIELQLLQGQAVRGGRVRVALISTMASMPIMAGRGMLLGAPSILLKIQSFSIGQVFGGLQSSLSQMMPSGSSGLLNRVQDRLGGGLARAKTFLLRAMPYLISSAAVLIFSTVCIVSGLVPLGVTVLLFGALMVVISPQIGRIASTSWSRSGSSSFPLAIALIALIGMVADGLGAGGDAEDTGGSVLVKERSARDRVYEELRSSGRPMTAKQVADELNISEDVARIALNNLVKDSVRSAKSEGVGIKLIKDRPIEFFFTKNMEEERIVQELGIEEAADPAERQKQIKILIREIEKEQQEEGSGQIPLIFNSADIHGQIDKLSEFLSDYLHAVCGFEGAIEWNRDVEEQLNEQGLSLSTIKGGIVINMDLVDRAVAPVKCYLLLRSLKKAAPKKVILIAGNHDKYQGAAVEGFHLPHYDGFDYLEDEKIKEVVEKKRREQPGKVNSRAWWQKLSARYEALQANFEKEFTKEIEANGNLNLEKKTLDQVCEEFKDFMDTDIYKTASEEMTQDQKSAWENFTGYFQQIGERNNNVGLKHIGQTSSKWWQEVHAQLISGHQARRDILDEEEAQWEKAITLAEHIKKALARRTEDAINGKIDEINDLETGLGENAWTYEFFEWLNSHAYEPVWNPKDHIFHNNWGITTINDVNNLIELEIIDEQKLTFENYPESPILQEMAEFSIKSRDWFVDVLGELTTHGSLPVNSEGDFEITFNGKEYTNREIFTAYDEMTHILRNPEATPAEKAAVLWDQIRLYSDRVTKIKPKHIEASIKKFGVANLLEKLGIIIWIKGHNPLDKMPSIYRDKDGVHVMVNNDSSMADNYGATGLVTFSGLWGLLRRGFAIKESKELEWNPDMVIFKGDKEIHRKAEGIEKAEYLTILKKDLESRVEKMQQSAEKTNIIKKIVTELQNLSVEALAVVETFVRELMDQKELSLEDQYDTLENDAPEANAASMVMGLDVPLDNPEGIWGVKDDTRIVESAESAVALMKKVKQGYVFHHLGRPGGKYDPTKTVAIIMPKINEVFGKAFKKAGLDVIIARLPFRVEDVAEILKEQGLKSNSELENSVNAIEEEIKEINEELTDLRGARETVENDIARIDEAISEGKTTEEKEEEKLQELNEKIANARKAVSDRKLVLDKKRLDLAGVVRDFIVAENPGKKFFFMFENIRSYSGEGSGYLEIAGKFAKKLLEVTGAVFHVNAAPPDMHRFKNVSLRLTRLLALLGKEIGYFLGPNVFGDVEKIDEFNGTKGPKLHLFAGKKLDKILIIANLRQKMEDNNRVNDKIKLDGFIGKIVWGIHHGIPGVEEYVMRKEPTKGKEIIAAAKKLAEDTDLVELPIDGIKREVFKTEKITRNGKEKTIEFYKYSVIELKKENFENFDDLNKVMDNGPQTREMTRELIRNPIWEGIFINGSPGVFETEVKIGDIVELGAEHGSQGGTKELTLSLVEAHESGKVFVVEAGGETLSQGYVAVGYKGLTKERIKALNMILGGGAGMEGLLGLDKLDTLNWARKGVADVKKALPKLLLLGMAVGLAALVLQYFGIDIGSYLSGLDPLIKGGMGAVAGAVYNVKLDKRPSKDDSTLDAEQAAIILNVLAAMDVKDNNMKKIAMSVWSDEGDWIRGLREETKKKIWTSLDRHYNPADVYYDAGGMVTEKFKPTLFDEVIANTLSQPETGEKILQALGSGTFLTRETNDQIKRLRRHEVLIEEYPKELERIMGELESAEYNAIISHLLRVLEINRCDDNKEKAQAMRGLLNEKTQRKIMELVKECEDNKDNYPEGKESDSPFVQVAKKMLGWCLENQKISLEYGYDKEEICKELAAGFRMSEAVEVERLGVSPDTEKVVMEFLVRKPGMDTDDPGDAGWLLRTAVMQKTFNSCVVAGKFGADFNVDVIFEVLAREFEQELVDLRARLGKDPLQSESGDPAVQAAINYLVAERISRDQETDVAYGSAGLIPEGQRDKSGFVSAEQVNQALRKSRYRVIEVDVDCGCSQLEGAIREAMRLNSILQINVPHSQMAARSPAQIMKDIQDAMQRTKCNIPVVVHGELIPYAPIDQKEILISVFKEMRKAYDAAEHREGAFEEKLAEEAGLTEYSIKADIEARPHYIFQEIDTLPKEILEEVRKRSQTRFREQRGESIKRIKEMIRAGFTSIVVNASALDDEIAGEIVSAHHLFYGDTSKYVVQKVLAEAELTGKIAHIEVSENQKLMLQPASTADATKYLLKEIERISEGRVRGTVKGSETTTNPAYLQVMKENLGPELADALTVATGLSPDSEAGWHMVLNVLALVNSGLTGRALLAKVIADAPDLDGLHKDTLEEIESLAWDFKNGTLATKDHTDSLFVKCVKKAYNRGVKSGKITPESKGEEIYAALLAELEPALRDMNEDLRALALDESETAEKKSTALQPATTTAVQVWKPLKPFFTSIVLLLVFGVGTVLGMPAEHVVATPGWLEFLSNTGSTIASYIGGMGYLVAGGVLVGGVVSGDDVKKITKGLELSKSAAKALKKTETLEKSKKEKTKARITKYLKNTPYQTFTVEQIAKEMKIGNKEAKELLEDLWLKNDNIEHIKLDGGIGYAWCPISPAVQITRQGPEDFPVGVPMRVIIGHSEVRDYLNLTIKEQGALVEKYIVAGYKITLPFGDFPAMLDGKDCVANGKRKFPVTYDGIMKKAKELGGQDKEYTRLADAVSMMDEHENKSLKDIQHIFAEYYEILEPKLKAELSKVVADAEKNAETPDQKQKDANAALLEKYAKFLPPQFENGWLIEKNDGGLNTEAFQEEIIGRMLNNLEEVKARIIEEISTVHEINSQVGILFKVNKNMSLPQIIHQINIAYEPIDGIRNVAIPMDVGELRLRKMIEAMVEAGIPEETTTKEQAMRFAEELGLNPHDIEVLDSDKSAAQLVRAHYKMALENKIIYGGGANEKNIKDVCKTWKGGAFIGRAIYEGVEAIANSVKIALAGADARTANKPTVIYNLKAGRIGDLAEYMRDLVAGFEKEGKDLSDDVKVIFGVSLLDVAGTWKQMQDEEGADNLFTDLSNEKLPIEITIDGRGKEVATKPVGPFTGQFPAKFLFEAGVTNVLVDPEADYAARQVNNLVSAGITPVVIGKAVFYFSPENTKKFGNKLEKIETVKNMESVELTPIHEVRNVVAGLMVEKNYRSLPGRDMFAALEGTDKMVMAANMRTPLSLPGVIRAAKELGSVIVFQQAMSELDYTWPGGYSVENAKKFVHNVKVACAKLGFKDFAIKGDHITVKVDKTFLEAQEAQDKVKDLFENILAEQDVVQREQKFRAAMQDNKLMSDANVANAMESVEKALDLVKAEVAADMTVFALDASFMPMPLNVRITAFLAGFIPEDAGLEAEVGEIGGDRNSTIADALEFITGVRYKEEILTDENGVSYSELVLGENGQRIVEYEGKGLLDYNVKIQRLALNNGTEHGNNYDVQGNLIETEMNLKETAAITKALEQYGIKIVQHGITGTPIGNLPALRAAGITEGHVGTNWQNVVWEVLTKEAANHHEVAEPLVNRMIDRIIARFGEKYGVEQREGADEKRLTELLGKELKQVLGEYYDEFLALPQDIIAKIDAATEESATEHLKGFRSDGSAEIVSNYIEAEAAPTAHAFTAGSGRNAAIISLVAGLIPWILLFAYILGFQAGGADLPSPISIPQLIIFIIPGFYLMAMGWFRFWDITGAVEEAMLEARWDKEKEEEKEKDDKEPKYYNYDDFEKFRNSADHYNEWLNEMPEGALQSRLSLARNDSIAWRETDGSIEKNNAAMAILKRDNEKAHNLVMFHETFGNHDIGMLALLPGMKFIVDRIRDMSPVEQGFVLAGVVVLGINIITIVFVGVSALSLPILISGVVLLLMPLMRDVLKYVWVLATVTMISFLPRTLGIWQSTGIPGLTTEMLFNIGFVAAIVWVFSGIMIVLNYPVSRDVNTFDLSQAEVTTPSGVKAGGADTLKVVITLPSGAVGQFVVPAGTSTGEDEAKTVPVEQAIENVAKIHERVVEAGLCADQVVEIGQLILEMQKEEELGAQATLGYQMAAAWAAASEMGIKPYEFIRQLVPDIASEGILKTVIQHNITNGGEHADNSLDMQEFMVVPVGKTIAENNEMCLKIDRELGNIYIALGLEANTDDGGVGDLRGKEGGYKIPNLTTEKLRKIYASKEKYNINNLNLSSLKRDGIGVHEFVLNCQIAAIKNAGYEPSTSKQAGTVSLALDAASTSMLVEGTDNRYHYEGREISSNYLVGIYAEWVNRYPIDSIEDGLAENDWDGWMNLIEKVGDKVLLIGDDNLVTQAGRLNKFIDEMKARGFVNEEGMVTKKIGILIKLNQNGFLTTGYNNPQDGYLGTLEVIRLARSHGIEVIISHRSKEAEPEENEVSIAELAAAVGAYALKSGDFVQPTRAVKEARLAEIDDELRQKAKTGSSKIMSILLASLLVLGVFPGIASAMTDTSAMPDSWLVVGFVVASAFTLVLGINIIFTILSWILSWQHTVGRDATKTATQHLPKPLEARVLPRESKSQKTLFKPIDGDMEVKSLIQGTVGENEQYIIRIPGICLIPGLHGVLITLGAWAVNRLPSARKIDNIKALNENEKMMFLLGRDEEEEFESLQEWAAEINSLLERAAEIKVLQEPNTRIKSLLALNAETKTVLERFKGTSSFERDEEIMRSDMEARKKEIEALLAQNEKSISLLAQDEETEALLARAAEIESLLASNAEMRSLLERAAEIKSLLARAVADTKHDITYGWNIDLTKSKKLMGKYTTNDFKGIKTIGVSASVLAIVEQGRETAGWKHSVAKGLLILTAQYQVRKYNKMVRAREDMQEELELQTGKDVTAINAAVLEKLNGISLSDEKVLAKEGGTATFTPDMILKAIIAMMPVSAGLQEKVQVAINEALKTGTELDMQGLFETLMNGGQQNVPALEVLASMKTAESAALVSTLLDMLKKGQEMEITAGAVDKNIKEVKVVGEISEATTAKSMLDMIEEARAAKADTVILNALEQAVKAAQGTEALPIEEGRILANIVEQAGTQTATNYRIGQNARGVNTFAEVIGWRTVEIGKDAKVQVPVLGIIESEQTEVDVDVKKIFAKAKDKGIVPEGMLLSLFETAEPLPAQIESGISSLTSSQKIYTSLARLIRSQRTRSYLSYREMKLNPAAWLLAAVDTLWTTETGLIREGSIVEDLAKIKNEDDALKFINKNTALSVVIRRMVLAKNRKTYYAEQAKVGRCMTNRIKPARVGIEAAPVEVEAQVDAKAKAVARGVLNARAFSKLLSALGLKMKAIGHIDKTGEKIEIPQAMIEVIGFKAKVGTLVDTWEKLPPITIYYEELRKILKRCLRSLKGSA